MNLKGAGEVMRDGRAETLAYCEWGGSRRYLDVSLLKEQSC